MLKMLISVLLMWFTTLPLSIQLLLLLVLILIICVLLLVAAFSPAAARRMIDTIDALQRLYYGTYANGSRRGRRRSRSHRRGSGGPS